MNRNWNLKDSDKGTTAFWLTIATIGGLSLASVVGSAIGNETIILLWAWAAGALGIAVVVGTLLMVVGYRIEAARIFFAVAASVLVLTVTCFANVAL